MKRTAIRKKRWKMRKGEPTLEEKARARMACMNRARCRCEVCASYTDWLDGHLHHVHAKRRFGWREGEGQQHQWLCAECHSKAHNAGGKPCPAKGNVENRLT